METVATAEEAVAGIVHHDIERPNVAPLEGDGRERVLDRCGIAHEFADGGGTALEMPDTRGAGTDSF